MAEMKMSIYDWFHSVWRNHPRCASTFSQCWSGRSARRGGEPCTKCLKEMLAATGKISVAEAHHFIKKVEELRKIEAEFVELIGEDIELWID